ncbi:MAG TPA: hypothetical protein DC047_16845 [Blastocatellia bacterium]|nr:hypothetical protein [Blastocatellia bacterium]
MHSEQRLNLLKRITINPEQCGGRPCIRGMRIRVTDVLALLANSLKPDEILQELPDLNEDDLRACMVYAAQQLGGKA